MQWHSGLKRSGAYAVEYFWVNCNYFLPNSLMHMLTFSDQSAFSEFHGCKLILHSSLCQRIFHFLVRILVVGAAGVLNPIVHTIKRMEATSKSA